MAKERNITTPKVGDVRSVVDGTTTYYTKANLDRLGGTSRVETPTAMGADTLNSNESLIEVPNVPPTGETDALGGYLESFQQNQADAFTQAQEQRTKQAEGKTSTAFEDYIKGLAGEQSVEGLTMQAEQDFGTPQLEQEVNRLNADLMSEQRALKKRLDVLNRNAQGGLATGVAGEIANAQRESYSKQADIAVVQMAAQGRFDSAKAMADRKAAIQFADQTRDLNLREKIYDENKEIFTKEEQRLFETKQGDRNRKLEQQRDDFVKLQDVKLEALKMAQMNGAPVSILEAIQNAKSPVQVLEAGGQYGSVDMLDRAYKLIRNQTAQTEYNQLVATLNGENKNDGLTDKQREKIGTFKESKDSQVLITLNQNLGTLKDLYETYGTYNPFDPDARNKINAIKSQLEIDIAVAGGQGAISEQEADRYKNLVGGGYFQTGDQAASAINQAMDVNKTKIKNNISYIESSIPGAKVFEPFKQFLEQEEAERYLDEQLKAKKQTDEEAISNWVNNTSTPAVNL
jgi:hypothetical protein